MARQDLLGKIFISHTSTDKPFARKLVRSLHRAGFQTWLDERELLPGDRLPEKIAAAVTEAKVLLVVVSRASARSKWLSYELNLASDRMVAGKCRVIPIVISEEPLPNAVQGLLYADFRSSFALGMKGVLTALRHELKERTRSAGFWVVADDLVKNVFGRHGFVIGAGDFDPLSYDILDVRSADHGTVNVVYDKAPAYGRPPKPIGESWWDEYVRARGHYDEALYLVLSERPVQLISSSDAGKPDRVTHRVFDKDTWGDEKGHVVFADLSRLRTDARRSAVVASARAKLEELARTLPVRHAGR